MQEIINDMSKFQEMIDTTVDMEHAKTGDFVIKPDFDDALAGEQEYFVDYQTTVNSSTLQTLQK